MAANDQTKTTEQAGTTGGQQDQTSGMGSGGGMGGSGMGGFERTQLPGGRTTITVPASMSQALEPKRLLWYGGLAALGVVGVLEWPIVAVVGAATYVSERFAREDVANTQR